MPSNFHRLSHLHHPAALLSHPSSPSLTQTSALLSSFAVLFPTRCSRGLLKRKASVSPFFPQSFNGRTVPPGWDFSVFLQSFNGRTVPPGWDFSVQGSTHRAPRSAVYLGCCPTTSSTAQSSESEPLRFLLFPYLYQADLLLSLQSCLGYNWETPTHLTSLRLEITLSLKLFLTAILLQYNSWFPPLHLCLH